MKNLILILSVAISLSMLWACNDAAGVDPPPTPDPIVGHWKMTKIVKDGVDLTDDCTTRSDILISKDNSFSGHDYDAVGDGCVLTNFSGTWVRFSKTTNRYTFIIHGAEFIVELNGDKLRAEFTHEFDGKLYIEEHIRQ